MLHNQLGHQSIINPISGDVVAVGIIGPCQIVGLAFNMDLGYIYDLAIFNKSSAVFQGNTFPCHFNSLYDLNLILLLPAA